MTKQIHVVNGDASIHPVNVIVQERIKDEWVDIETLKLDCPGQLITKTIWKERRLIIMERT